jgi:transposase-like protein
VLLELTLALAEQRFNAVMEVLRDGLTVVEVADRYGVSRQTVHGWLRRYASGALDALADRSRRPRCARTRCLLRSRPACASCADAILSGVSAGGGTAPPHTAWWRAHEVVDLRLERLALASHHLSAEAAARYQLEGLGVVGPSWHACRRDTNDGL